MQPNEEIINTTLAVISERKVDSGHSIKYKNKYYRTLLANNQPIYFKKGTSALVIESFDGHLYTNVLDQLFILEEIPEHQQHSNNFEGVKEADTKEKKHYIPPMNHPWKHASYLNYLMKMEHRNNSANI